MWNGFNSENNFAFLLSVSEIIRQFCRRFSVIFYFYPRRTLHIVSKLKNYFPLIREREELLSEIKENPKLREIYEEWSSEKREEFLDFCTGIRGMKVLYDSFFKEVMNPEYTPERLEELLCVILK